MTDTPEMTVAHRSNDGSSFQDDNNVRLAFITNFGQARNYAALKNQLGMTARAIIFYTNANLDMPAKVAKICDAADILYEEIVLPDRPTVPTAHNLKTIEKIYTDIFDRLRPREVFVCNREGHYHFAADIAVRRGISLTFFEEGLSSYTKTPNFSAINNKQALASFLHDLRLYMKNSNSLIIKFLYFLIVLPIREVRYLVLFAKNVTPLLSKYFYKSAIWTRLGDKFGHKIMKKFYQQRTIYDNIYLVFPDKNSNFAPENITQLHLSANYSSEDKELESHLCDLPPTIYLSQRYLQTPDYYKAVAAGLKKSMISAHVETILIKFHPREDTESKDWLRTALRDEAISFSESPAIEEYAFEELLRYRHFKTLLAISSTSLIYAQKYDPDIRAIAIGDIVAENLVALNKRVAVQIEKDVESISRFDHVTFL